MNKLCCKVWLSLSRLFIEVVDKDEFFVNFDAKVFLIERGFDQYECLQIIFILYWEYAIS